MKGQPVTADTPDPRPVSPPSELTAEEVRATNALFEAMREAGLFGRKRQAVEDAAHHLAAVARAAARAAPQADAGTLREAVDKFIRDNWYTEKRGYVFLDDLRAALAASSPATAGRDVDEANWQPGYSEEFKRGFMTAIQEGLDPQTLAMAMDIAADTPIFDTGLTRADVVVREYERLRPSPATAGREE